jgi:hypothetical protein
LTTDGAPGSGPAAGSTGNAIARLAERDVAPAEPGRAHVHRDAADVGDADIEHAGAGLELEVLAAGVVRHGPADAAHAVAAGTHLRAVDIEDADVGLRAAGPGLGEHHHLVEMRGAVPPDGGGLRGAEGLPAPTQVDDHDLVAETVHLAVGDGR